MRIFVDKLPETPEDCLFSLLRPDYMHRGSTKPLAKCLFKTCHTDPSELTDRWSYSPDNYTCDVERCPYLHKFNSVDTIFPTLNILD